MSYTPPNEMLDASWSGAVAYTPTAEIAPGWWLSADALLPVGFVETRWGTPFVTKQQFVDPVGWQSSSGSLPLVTLDWQYIPRWEHLAVSWVGAPNYTPTYTVLPVQWSMGLAGEDQYLFVESAGDSCAFGDTSLRMDQWVVFDGWDSLTLPSPSIWSVLNASWQGAANYAPEREHLAGSWAVGTFNVTLKPKSFDAQRHGQASIWNRDLYLTGIGGIPSQLVFGGDYPPGTPEEDSSETVIWNRNQFISLDGFDSQTFGTTFMGGGVRWVITHQIPPPNLPAPWLSFSPRWITAGDLKAPGVSVPLVGGTRYLEPAGYEATLWGDRIIPEAQVLYPEGQVLTLWGDAKPWNYTTWVSPLAIKWQAEEVRFGTQHVWNWQRYITQYYDTEHVDSFGIWTEIENRNKVIAHHSTAPGFLPMPKIDNAARPLRPAPIWAPAEPEYYKAGMVSHRVREYSMEGIEPPLMSRWLTVVNDAKVVAPSGYVATRFGDNIPTNTRRYFPYISGGDQQIIGTPMVSDRIRQITFESRYSIQPPVPEGPEVKLHTRYIEPPALDASRYGAPFLEIHWTKFFPRWTHVELFGEARVNNLTPELATRGRDSQEFGDTFVRLQWRPIAPAETFTQRIGSHRISDRRQVVLPQPAYPVKLGDKHKVERTGPYIPEIQWIIHKDPHGYDSRLLPVPLEDHGMGEVNLNLQFARVIEEDVQTLFGNATVTANTIRVEPGYWELMVGDPMVALKNRALLVEKWPDDEVFEPSKPRVSPHTIWAVVEAPDQAKRNHGYPQLHYVDHHPINNTLLKGPGTPTIALKHRRVSPYWSNATQPNMATYGKPVVSLGTNYIQPEGWLSFRRGFHWMSGAKRTLVVAPYIEPGFDTPTVTHVDSGPKTVRPQGFSGAVPAPVVEHFNRELPLPGFDALQMGSSRQDSPYTWKTLHVGFPMPTIPEGFNADQFGSTWVSLRVRDIFVPGSDFFLCEYDVDTFAQRMRVRRTPTPPPVARSIAAHGFNAFDSAASGNVSNWVQYIRPDGNMDNYRKGAPQ